MSYPTTLHDDARGTPDEARSDAPGRPSGLPGSFEEDAGAVFETTRRRAAGVGDDWQNRIEIRLERIERALDKDAGGVSPGAEVGALLHRFYKALDRLDAHVTNDAARATELENRLRAAVPEALAASIPAVEAALLGDGSQLNAQLAAIEVRLGACHAAVERLLQRPVPDPTLGEKVAGGQRRLSEDLSRRTAAINRRMDMLTANVSHTGATLARDPSRETSSRLDAVEARLASVALDIDGLLPGVREAMRAALAELIASETRDVCQSAARAALHGNLSN